MNKIYFTKRFKKHFQQRIFPHKNLVNRYNNRIELFLKDKSNPSLKDHKLMGDKKGKRSFSITGDVRVIYQEDAEDIIFIFIDIGTHNQVYY